MSSMFLQVCFSFFTLVHEDSNFNQKPYPEVDQTTYFFSALGYIIPYSNFDNPVICMLFEILDSF